MTGIDFSKINIESLFYTGGDYYLYECYEGSRFVCKAKFKHKDLMFELIPQQEHIKEFEDTGSVQFQDGNLTRFFKKIGNP